jgi:hypothetical protein
MKDRPDWDGWGKSMRSVKLNVLDGTTANQHPLLESTCIYCNAL